MTVVPVNPSNGRLRRLGELARAKREEHEGRTGRKFYQRDAARVAGINEATYRGYEYGRAQMPENVAKSLAAEYGIHWQDFYRFEGQSKSKGVLPYDDVSTPALAVPDYTTEIPFVGNIGANSKADWFDPTQVDELIPVPWKMASPRGQSVRFACRVVGDSCYDLLWPDDIAIFHKHEVPRLGQVMVFRAPDDRVTIKQIKHDGKGFFLHPLNPAYDDEPAVGVVVGYLVGIIRQMGSREITIYDEHGITP